MKIKGVTIYMCDHCNMRTISGSELKTFQVDVYKAHHYLEAESTAFPQKATVRMDLCPDCVNNMLTALQLTAQSFTDTTIL